jgi:hypothetical protein
LWFIHDWRTLEIWAEEGLDRTVLLPESPVVRPEGTFEFSERLPAGW